MKSLMPGGDLSSLASQLPGPGGKEWFLETDGQHRPVRGVDPTASFGVGGLIRLVLQGWGASNPLPSDNNTAIALIREFFPTLELGK